MSTILLRRGPKASLPTLAVGEAGWCTDTFELFIGSSGGNKVWGHVPTFGEVQTALAAADSAVDFNGQQLTGVATPSLGTDAANKSYVDNVVSGLDVKDSVRAATTTAGTLATSFANGSTIDGVTLATNDRILIKDQSTGSENGIYTVNSSGAPTRATDFDEDSEVTGGAFCFVEEGTSNGDTGWVMTNDGAVTVGTTALTFSKFSSTVSISNLDDLTDVTISSVGAGEILGYNGGWVNRTLAEAGIQAELTFGIADTNALKVNDASVSAGDGAVFTSTGLQGVPYGIADTNLLKVDGTASSGNAALFTANGLVGRAIGIADTNMLRVDDAAAADGDIAYFTANGISGSTTLDGGTWA